MSGRYNQPVSIKTKARAKTATGGYTETRSLFAFVWAEITWDSGTEYVQAAQLNADAKGKLKCRYTAGVTPDMEIHHNDGRIFEIVGEPVNIREKGAEMMLLIRSRTDKGANQ